jgi:hypothetical protein
MKTLYQVISWVALVATLAPSVLFFLGSMDLSQVQTAMMAATVVWFVFTPLWMGRDEKKTRRGGDAEMDSRQGSV